MKYESKVLFFLKIYLKCLSLANFFFDMNPEFCSIIHSLQCE